jgi:tungstate transport system substrate-binding protein
MVAVVAAAGSPAQESAGPVPASAVLRMSTTTSTENSGLLDVLLPPFEKKLGLKVHVIAVGTGKALKLGENGDVDVVLVHDRESEDRFVAAGFGVNARDVMYNDFVIVGPPGDPAAIQGGKDAAEALRKIRSAKSAFVSRGDDSGTHKKELALWKAAGIDPKGEGYLEIGQGMGAALMAAHEKKAYCLADRGTFLAMCGKVDLPVLCEGDERLFNPYRVIAVNPDRHAHAKYVEAMALIGWLTSSEGQKAIGDYKKDGLPMFIPSAYGVRR